MPKNIKKMFLAAFCLAFSMYACTSALASRTLSEWDFSKGAQGWTGNGYLRLDKPTPEGMRIKSIGVNPLMKSPVLDYPSGLYVRVTFRLKAESGAAGYVYLGKDYNERERVKFLISKPGDWRDYSFFLPSSEKPRLWISPIDGEGKGEIAWIRVESAARIEPPVSAKPLRATPATGKSLKVKSGGLVFAHFGRSWDDFAVYVNGVEMASSRSGGVIGAMIGGKPEWLDVSHAKFAVRKEKNSLVMTAEMKDSQGVSWKLKRSVSPGAKPGSIKVSAELAAGRNRNVTHMPWLTLLPGLGTFGEHKKQALFAGLEYLADEPSGSEADLTGP
ncbi:MAG TPA: hypothetical protein PLQ76_05155, partial [bacterium]|nr:hypothetical protein [bacterium]